MNRTTKVAVALIVAAGLSTMVYALQEQRAMAHLRLHLLTSALTLFHSDQTVLTLLYLLVRVILLQSDQMLLTLLLQELQDLHSDQTA
jgi:hypothetical protein